MKERDIDRLATILDYCERIEKNIERFGNSFDVFKDDFAYQDSVKMNLFQIGEQVNHISEECQEQIGEIPWHSIVGLRNRIAHGYDNVNDDRIWDIVIRDIPVLKNKIQDFLLENGESEWQ